MTVTANGHSFVSSVFIKNGPQTDCKIPSVEQELSFAIFL